MEFWFVLTVGSALLVGVASFGRKVIAERGYDVPLISAYSGVISASLLLLIAIQQDTSYELSSFLFLILSVGALLYLVANITTNRALQAIDSTIYFPIYKIVGPLLVIVAGIILFSESFSDNEWLGLGLSLLVPVLLITSSEKIRQNNLWLGLWLLLLTTLMTATAAIISKEVADTASDLWFALAVGDGLLAVSAAFLFIFHNRKQNIFTQIKQHSSTGFILWAVIIGVIQAIAFAMLLFAYRDGSLGIIYTVHSLYILIPIVLSIIYYHEHWNVRKVLAIILSIAALWFLQ